MPEFFAVIMALWTFYCWREQSVMIGRYRYFEIERYRYPKLFWFVWISQVIITLRFAAMAFL